MKPDPTITAPAGTIVHINGIPFALPADTAMEGTETNAALAGLNK